MSVYRSVFLIVLACAWTMRAAQAPDPPPPVAPEPQHRSAPYAKPSDRATLRTFILDTAGPHPLFMGIAAAGIHQATNNPPEWRQGAGALSKRFGSNMGITAAGNAARFGLGKLFNEDTTYYRCRCAGVFPRLRHAAVSALIARRESDGRSALSIPGLVAPYAATMTAVYAWYPQRYDAKDAFRMGNYNLLGTVGSNITFEFMPKRVWKALGRFHMSSSRMADQP